MLNPPFSQDAISDICGHMIRQDFYYKMIPNPLPLSLTEAYTTTRILEKQLTIQANPSNHL